MAKTTYFELPISEDYIPHWGKWECIREIIQNAVVARPETMTSVLFRALQDQVDDIKGFGSHGADEAVAEKIAAKFREEHGANAVPVDSIGDSAKAEHFNLRGVVVPAEMMKVLEAKINTQEILRERTQAGTETFGWTELSKEEQENLFFACEKIDPFVEGDILERVSVVEFVEDNLEGSHKAGKIKLSKKVLRSGSKALQVLIHEEAHYRTSSGNGSKFHVLEVEELWLKVYQAEVE